MSDAALESHPDALISRR